MGDEANCTATFNGNTTKGKARLEAETLEFRAPDVRVSIPFKQITSVTARSGALAVASARGTISLTLGDSAEKWAFKIQHPRSRLEKIGVKPEWRASAVGVDDDGFLKELEAAVAELAIGRVLNESDAIFFGTTTTAQLSRFERLKRSLKPNGALWVIRPKGRPEISEQAVMAAGKAAGLVDVKVVSFSATHTAEKFVIPVKNRAKHLYLGARAGRIVDR